MVTISINAEAYEAILATLPKGERRPRTKLAADGGFRITLERAAVDRLAALRGPGESYSDVILRLAKATS
jgi:predicted CopG family antitoxin